MIPETSLELDFLNKQWIHFSIFNITDQAVCDFRMYFMAKCPTMAINQVDIFDESEAMIAPEFLSGNLGRVPLISNKVDEFLFPEECDCTNHCEKCGVILNLKVKAPENGIHIVTEKDLVSEDPRVNPVDLKGYVVVKIHHGQELDIRCLAQKGRAETHMKWRPVSVVIPLAMSKERKSSSKSPVERCEIKNHFHQGKLKDYEVKVEIIGQFTTDELWERIKKYFKENL